MIISFVSFRLWLLVVVAVVLWVVLHLDLDGMAWHGRVKLAETA